MHVFWSSQTCHQDGMDPIEDKPVKIRSTWDGQTLVMTLRLGWTAVGSLTTKLQAREMVRSEKPPKDFGQIKRYLREEDPCLRKRMMKLIVGGASSKTSITWVYTWITIWQVMYACSNMESALLTGHHPRTRQSKRTCGEASLLPESELSRPWQ